ARLARKIHEKIGISVSIGLSHNKFLAKVASDLDKPRGFSVIGKAETRSFLRSRPVSTIWGVGKMTQKSLARSGVTEISHLLKCDQADLVKQYGVMGVRLYQFARGIDHRKVSPVSETKSISNETTFNEDIRDLDVLERALWKLCENVSRRAKKAGLAGRTITIKLKSASFRTRTRSTSLDEATLLAERIFAAARPHLARECTGTSWRLLGAGISHLEPADPEKAPLDLDSGVVRQAKAELAMDKLRNKFGPEAVTKGRGLERKP
ncbi:MAG TPA: DNA polymerase IV, partial [Rhizobiales bacterium]|nr:DNA polymerase IV [Hyphomicrobiales bacterium]